MKWCRYQLEGKIGYGVVHDNGDIVEVSGDPLGEHTKADIRHPLDQVKLLAPIIPPMLYAAASYAAAR